MNKTEKKLEKKLLGNLDAKIWAEEFVKTIKKKPQIATHEGTMIAWFANAIMAGYDAPQNISKQKVREATENLFYSNSNICYCRNCSFFKNIKKLRELVV